VTSGRSRELSRYLLIRLALFGTLAILCALAVTEGMFFLAGLLGIDAVLDQKGTKRREVRRRAREVHDTAQTRAADLSAQRVRGCQE
jgi:hypothetical protein